MKMRPLASILVIAVVSSVTLAFSAIISSATDEAPRAFNNRSIEELLKTGWAPLDGAQLTFRTLDDNTQQVNPDEIWRIRGAATSEEPPGAIVIDYAFERIYVKESLANVVEKVSGVRPLKKFTLPSGAPVYIVTSKVISITRPIAHQHHQNAHAVIVAREGQTQVQESREAISEALVK